MSFTERTKAPFRLDVVGSFLRPDAIKEARKENDVKGHLEIEYPLTADRIRVLSGTKI